MISSKILTLAPLAGALLVASCNTAAPGPAPADTSKVADEVKQNMDKLIAAFSARDVGGSVAFDAPDFVGMLHGTADAVGPEGDMAITKQQVADPAMKYAVQNAKVDVAAAGDMAVWHSTYDYTFTDPVKKAPTTEHGNWVVIWKKQKDGSMKIATSIIADIPAAKPAG